MKYCLLGLLAGILTRLTDFLPYNNLWSFPSIATLYGFWIASITYITYKSDSHKEAFIHTLMYMLSMTISFYSLKYILGFFIPLFSNEGMFQTKLFLIYSILSFICAIGSTVLYFWNNDKFYNGFLYSLPVSGLLAEAIGCGLLLMTQHILLVQTVFDIVCATFFHLYAYKHTSHKYIYIGSVVVITLLVFFFIYQPFLIS